MTRDMTREEAINIMSQMIKDEEGFLSDNTVEAHKMAIKALKQEPCEDAISREDALMCLTGEIKETDTIETIIARFVRRIRKLPTVTPQQKIGHWIDDKCSVCGKGIEDLIDSREWYRNEEPNFCPFCGLKLVNSQESEEQNT